MTGLRFVHLIGDSPFIDTTMAQFNALTPHNRYLFVTDKTHYTFKYIKSHEQIELYACDRDALQRQLTDQAAYDVLVLHSLFTVDITLLRSIPDRISIWWISWGYDLYNRHLIDIELFHERTQALRRELGRQGTGKRFFKKDDLRDIISILFSRPRPASFLFGKLKERITLWRESPQQAAERTRSTLEEVIRRVNYCSTIIPDEFDRLSPKGFFTARRLPFNYPFDRDICRAEAIAEDPIAQGSGILIGNSASFENNHADLFEILRHIPLPEHDIVVPLNYGDRAYAREITRIGNECFGKRFRPLLDFMPFAQYTELLRSCSSAIFYHERQQAFGSVILTLWNGSKVFMSKSSILYHYLKKRGIVVFTIPDDLTAGSLATPLAREEVIANRTILSAEYSYAAIRTKMQTSIETIGKDRAAVQ